MRTSRNVIVEPKCTFLGLLLELRLVQKRPSSIIVVLLLLLKSLKRRKNKSKFLLLCGCK